MGCKTPLFHQHCANDDREYGALNPVTFGEHRGNPSNDVLIDRCQFLWNSGTGLMVGGNYWTVRDSLFKYNGCSGMAGAKGEDGSGSDGSGTATTATLCASVTRSDANGEYA